MITYEGKTVALFDMIEVPKQGKLILRFLGTDSEWRQGVRLGDMVAGTDLRLTVAGHVAPGMQLWQDTCPEVLEISYEAPSGRLTVYNIWDRGNGRSASQVAGAGMHIEVSSSNRVRTYRCNDGHEDTVFTHLVFSLEIA